MGVGNMTNTTTNADILAKWPPAWRAATYYNQPSHCHESGACDAGYSGYCNCSCAGCAKQEWAVPTFILGAPDPEMEEIEKILRAHDFQVVHALTGGVRPRGGDAYRADDMRWITAPVVLVECGQPVGWIGGGPIHHRIDHHRPGDPGHGRPVTDAVRASSLGQILDMLRLDQCPVCKDRIDWADTSGSSGAPCLGMADAGQPGGTGPCGDLHNWPLRPWEMERIRLIAAGDHSLAAAYAGEIPGVDPEALMRLRAETRAAFQRRPVGDVMADIASARAALSAAPRYELRPGDAATEVRDLRGRNLIPELPEAATRGGVPYIADGPTEPSGRAKVVCSGSPDVIQAFLEWAAKQGLVDAYGDPARGLAGAYVPLMYPCDYHHSYEAGCGDCTRQR